PGKPAVELIDQSVAFVEKADKRAYLAALIKAQAAERAIVFTRTKHGADRLARSLEASGIAAAAIHANKSQNNRTRTMDSFRSGVLRVLVATDLAARGIDVDGVSHVYNYELPEVPETYVHRIGRTARAGAEGAAVALCEPDEKPLLKAIEKLLRTSVPVAMGGAYALAAAEAAKAPRESQRDPRLGFREDTRNGREDTRSGREDTRRPASSPRSSLGARPQRAPQGVAETRGRGRLEPKDRARKGELDRRRVQAEPSKIIAPRAVAGVSHDRMGRR
ncbi:MAG: helicase C-terminal domain-containing protein, partial [Spirochaetaceae bacterium]|nr:helicase C-terminal domain-containing protein [Spirochaetaceae bacterium]